MDAKEQMELVIKLAGLNRNLIVEFKEKEMSIILQPMMITLVGCGSPLFNDNVIKG